MTWPAAFGSSASKISGPSSRLALILGSNGGLGRALARQLAQLDAQALADRVLVHVNHETSDGAERRDALLATLTDGLELHGWKAKWHDRGLRLTHGEHSVVLLHDRIGNMDVVQLKAR